MFSLRQAGCPLGFLLQSLINHAVWIFKDIKNQAS